MSCQSLSLAPADSQPLSSFHRTVHFSTDGESKSLECTMEAPREAEMDSRVGVSSWCGSDKMTRSAPAACGDVSGQLEGQEGARFPRLEECAHFHYGRVRLGGLVVKTLPDALPPHNDDEDGGWVSVSVHPHSEDRENCEDGEKSTMGVMSGEEESNSNNWLITRSAENFKMLDTMLHRCIYDRKVSSLPDLSVCVDDARSRSQEAYLSLIGDYLHHFSIIADDSINCGPILNWFQMDNKGHRLLVASEDTNSINTPAVAAAYSVKRYVSQARDEISFEVGDMISVIDMPGPSESTWWRGKRGFKVGFFPQHCVAVIGDKVPRNMKEPPPIVGSVAVAPIKPVLRKHGKLISLFRSFILSRPSRRSLRQQGILKERVFGCDLGEHLLNSGHEVPMVLSCCAKIIEQYGCVDGIYRLSGASSTTQRLRIAFDEERLPPLDQAPSDVHAVASLLKMYFRELPNPLCTYQLYTCFVNAVQGYHYTTNPDGQPKPEDENVQPQRLDDAEKLLRMRETVVKLPPPHYRTLAFLMRHLHHMSLLGSSTGMTARNMAIVWAPNLLRSPIQQHALQGVAVQAVVTEFLICYADLIFSDDQSQLCQNNISTVGSSFDQPDSLTSCSDHNEGLSIRRPKSLPLQTPTKLLSLEEARSKQQLRPSVSREPQYIEVGGGPNSLPRYHTIIQLPSGSAKRGLKRSPSGWRGLFFRASKHRPRATVSLGGPVAASSVPTHVPTIDLTSPVRAVVDDIINCKDKDPTMVVEDSRTARSCESLLSDGDSLPPLSVQPEKLSVNHHNRSVSCDSYFEASLAEMAGMRLRLSSQEREMDIFSEDDTTKQIWNKDGPSSADTSVEPSPTKLPRTAPTIKVPSPLTDNRKRTKLEDQLSDLLYIDCSTPEHRTKAAESAQASYNSPDNEGEAKRVCKDTSDVSNEGSLATSPQSLAVKVKMRDRGSPRRTSKGNISRHSHCGTPPSPKTIALPQRHSTLIRVDWPHSDNAQPASLDYYAYTQLQSDSECSLPFGESRDSLAKRLIESKESLMSRSNETDSLSVLNVGSTSCVPNIINSVTDVTMQTDIKDPVTEMQCDSVNIPKEEITDNRGSGYCNVDWSDGLMDSSMERSTISSDLDKSFEGKKYSSDKVSDYEGIEMARKSLISSYEEVDDDSSRKSEETKMKEKVKANRCSIAITPSEDNYSHAMIDSLDGSLSPVNISYQNLNRLSNISNDSVKTGTSKESTPTVSPLKDQERADEIYECFSFTRPSYIHLASSSGDSNTPGSPPQTKSPIKSTISITFKSPTKEEYRELDETSDTSQVVGEKNFESTHIAETALVPQNYDADLPTQEAHQPNKSSQDLIVLDSPVENAEANRMVTDADIYNQVKFFKQSINEVNSLLLEPDQVSVESESQEQSESQRAAPSQQGAWYENVCFDNSMSKKMPSPHHAYENLILPAVKEEREFQEKEKISPVLSLCIDRSYSPNKSMDVRKNCYENYTVPSSSKKEDTSLKKDNIENRKNSPKLSLQELDKENTADNGNTIASSDSSKMNRMSTTNVRQLANKFESPTENMGPFSFDRYSKLSISPSDKSQNSDRSKAVSLCEARSVPSNKMSLSSYTSSNKVSKNFTNTRSLDENAFIKEFGKHRDYFSDKQIEDSISEQERRRSLEADKLKSANCPKKLPDLNLNLQYENYSNNKIDKSLIICDRSKGQEIDESTLHCPSGQCASVTPTTENKISLVQARLSPKRNQRQKFSNFTETPRDLSESLSTSEISLDQDKKINLSRERIEKYKEERRLFLREKYSPHSFRGAGDLQLSCKNNKMKNDDYEDVNFEGVELRNPSKILERRNTADAAQRTKYSNVLCTNKQNSGDVSVISETVKCLSSDAVESPKVTHMQKKVNVESKAGNVQSHICSWDEQKMKSNLSCSSGVEHGQSLKDISVATKPKSLNISSSSDTSNESSIRYEKRSPSFNIRDMAAKFEQRSQNSSN